MSIARSFLLRFAAAHLSAVLITSFIFRAFLSAKLFPDLRSIGFAILVGTIFDFAVAIYTSIPFLIFISAFPDRLARRFGWKRLFVIILSVDVFVLSFVGVAEYFFFDEFSDRFNFIAVDYLVYTHEVLENIFESYPVIPIVLALSVASALLSFFASKVFLSTQDDLRNSWQEKWPVCTFVIIALTINLVFINEAHFFSRANFAEEVIGKNGLHALFAAYHNNEIKFDRFYTTTNSAEAVAFVHHALKQNHLSTEAPGEEVPQSIVRNIREKTPFQRMNVIVVIMESLSARFMKAYGSPNDLTPNLDKLAAEGLFFNHIYATGTRTVRGLEAIVLSIPPTPGQSIVRRPGGTGLFNIGTPFRDQGYRTNFIYGGRALFDNMGSFFAGNGFDVFDQSTFLENEIAFTNAWGVSDEDLYNQVLKISDEHNSKGESFLHIVLNTSNHRPYTYPEGRVSKKSGSGREGAVQYTDYAIGKFLADAKARPWFEDTLFVFVADHNASVAGQNQIDPKDYLIPMIFYSPKWIKPEVNQRMGSQIDLAPTLLEFLSASYQSRFFGMELQDDDPGRAFLATYQSVGYLTQRSLTVLSPNWTVQNYALDGSSPRKGQKQVIKELRSEHSPELVATVSYYKAASDWFANRLLEEKRRAAENINARD